MPLSNRTLRYCIFGALVLVAAFAIFETRPPAALGLEAPQDQFSAARAMSHLRQFAARPHPIGTEANAEARDYLVGALRELGADVHVEETVGLLNYKRLVRAGSAQNIVARWAGTANSRAVMLMAHYDSVPEGPGAADDGAGVIAILETVRALRSGAPLANDLIVLLTDGEEPGLLGASGYVADHPELAARLGVVLNLEARGSSGPALMFETSGENGWLIPEFARAAPHPMASSLMYSVYQRLPNNTDLSILKGTGAAALNFAFTETYQNYHSRLDTPEHLDPRSVQHAGANVLGLTRHFGNLPLTNTKKPDCVYFNWLGDRLVFYPEWVIWILMVATFGLLALAVARDPQRDLMKLSALAAFVILVVAVAGGTLLVWRVVGLLIGDSLLQGDTGSNTLLFGGFLTVGFGCGMLVLRALCARLGSNTLHTGLLLLAAVLAATASAAVPGTSYVLQWPVLCGVGILLVSRSVRQPTAAVWWGSLAAVPAILILGPLPYLLMVALDLGMASLLVAALLLSLLLAVAWPVFEFIVKPVRGVTIALLLAAAVMIFAGAALSHPSAQHPRRDTLIYSLNTDEGKAKWISYDKAPDAWTRQFLGAKPSQTVDPAYSAGLDRAVLSADAPVLPLAAPSVTVASDRRAGGLRILHLHLTAADGARTIRVRLPAGTDLQAAGWNGRLLPVDTEPSKHPWRLRYEAVPLGGVDLELHLRGDGPVECWVANSLPGLPELPDHPIAPRPEDLMADTGSDITLVARRYSF